MLVTDDGTTWTAITQPAHARLAGQVAALWDAPLEPEVVLGVEQHDVAWMQWDRRPPLHAEQRRAAAFFEADEDERLALWDRVGSKLEALDPYAAVLVSLHGTNVHTRYAESDDPRVARLLEGLREEQDDLLERVGRTREEAEADGDVVFALDQLSLVVCHGWPERELPAVRGTTVTLAPREDGAWTLDPWPLRVPEADLRLPVRRLTERFDDEAALHEALARHRYDLHPVRLRPV